MKAWIRIPLRILALVAMLAVMAAAILTGGYFYVEPSVPEAATLRDVPFQIPLTIYTRDGLLMDVYGTDRRDPVPYEEIPERLKQAFLAAEDDQFFEHNGVDYAGLARGAIFGLRNVLTGRNERIPGGSTITQQVSRTAQLIGREYEGLAGPTRKFREIILAYRIEDEYTKEEIFSLFLNTTFFGQRANGVASAARTYFNKTLDELTLGEIAIIAGIPQGPSIMNPYNGPERAAERRRYVLRRMFELDFITEAEREAALAEPIVAQIFDPQIEVEARYVAQMADAWCASRFGQEYCRTAGLRITTTVDSRAQLGANTGHRGALEQYDRRHGYRGPLANVDLSTLGFEVPVAVTEAPGEPVVDAAEGDEEPAAEQADSVAIVDPATVPTEALATLLEDYPPRYDTEAAVVLAVADLNAVVWMRSAGQVTLGVEAISWARPYLGDYGQGPYPELVSDGLAPGDIVRLRRLDNGSLELAQVPDGVYEYIQGALVALDPRDGAILALVGGYDFDLFQYNRVTQARRQPGSSFKPFFYMSALDRGYTLATIVNDAPFTEHSSTLERSRAVVNYEGEYAGEIPMRRALLESRNAPADRIIRDIGASYVGEYVERFGFDPAPGERNASLALGSLTVTPLELAAGYTVIANGGYAVGIRPEGGGQARPYLVERVETTEGEVLYDANEYVERVCPEVEAIADASARTGFPTAIANGSATAGVEASPDASAELTGAPSSFRPGCAERVESAQRIFLITTVLKDVIKKGSGAAANREFGSRVDLFGKTGTTNGPRDAWFAGGNADIVAVAWVGFDTDARELGRTSSGGEQGGRTAIPAWIEFMKVILEGMPDRELPQPPGIVELRIVPETGLVAADCRREFEWQSFLEENQPPREPETNCLTAGPLTQLPEAGSDPAASAPPSPVTSPLFE
jgi:penicillin-binding protein 1A